MSHLKPNSHLKDEVTPEKLYISRRKFIAGVSAVAAASFLTACARQNKGQTSTTSNPTAFCDGATASVATDELGNNLTSCNDVTNYNNYYEFSFNKEDVASLASNFKTSPWMVMVGGLVNKPGTFSIDQLIKKYKPEEHIYRMRCVETWSMVIPWSGFALARLLNDVQPKPEAKYVKFQTLLNTSQMPGETNSSFPWPYVEGLRLDEAMNNLTILATGLYGKPLPPQDGAPIRLVVPWKYGFKGIKAIITIDLVADMPSTFWPAISSSEYGFYANVNPNVPHPRWSQAYEQRFGDGVIPTLMFNGYDKVASLYDGMDLTKYY